ncbi:MAG TPA: hypothetical protein VF323_04745 [Candidatus Limnocylindrales bacterium]
MSDPEVHIAALERAGVIDAALAARLREAAAGAPLAPSPTDPDARTTPSVGARPGPTSAGSFFGPSVTVGEMFAYLGVAFLLGAWTAFLARVAGTTDRNAILTGGTTVAALAMFGLGVVLARGDPRRRRGAGVAFIATTSLAATAAAFLVQLDFLVNTLQDQAPGILIAGVAVAVAVGLRRLLPAVSTQLGLLGALTGLAAAILSWLQQFVHPSDLGGGFTTNPSSPAAEPVGLVLVAGAWWLLVALGLGIVGLFEARAIGADDGATRRAAITRFWAGLVAVVGLASALTHTGNLGGDRYGRVLEPWIADLAILALAAVLTERAFRRGSNAFILSAAIGLIIALTDFNFTYLSESTDVGLLIEGGILLGVGFAGDRLRRRLDRSGGWPPGSVADDREEPGVA